LFHLVVTPAKSRFSGCDLIQDDFRISDEKFLEQGVQAGKSGGGDQKSLADQLVDANAAVGKVATEVKQSKMKIKHLEKELKEKKIQLSSKQKEATSIEKEHEMRTAEVKKITSTLQSLGFDEARMELLDKVFLVHFLLCHCWSCYAPFNL